MECVQCQHQNPTDARFCEQCGTQLPNLCGTCGAAVSPTANFCRACGTQLPDQATALKSTSIADTSLAPFATPTSPAQAQRRQLSVLFCDLVGSTALAERLDPEALRDLMQDYQQTCREVIARYEGHVAQYLGDGLMVYFGWPQAHEDDAARAIRAGLEMVDAVSRLESITPIRARVGIHTGLVVVGETGQGDASIPNAAVGETPNIAARLQALAEPSRVVISDRTRSLAAGLYEYAELGARSLKGVSEPIRLFEVQSVRVIESLFAAAHNEQALIPLVGRDEEVQILRQRWERARAGEGQVLLITGEPGIGKSRLTQALLEQIHSEPHILLRYQCSAYHVNSPLFPIIDQIERAAAFRRDDSPDQKLDKLEALLAKSGKPIADAAALFAALLSLPMDRYPPLNFSAPKQKQRTLEALTAQIEALASQQPVLMMFEDLHWIDPSTQEALDLLLPRLHGNRVLLVATYRPEYRPAWIGQPNVVVLALNRLNRRDSMQLLTRMPGGGVLAQPLLEQILTHTDGVPLFIEELTKSVLESKLVHETDGSYVPDAPLPALAIPTTLRDSLVARLDRLAPVREIAQIGACIGREFSYELLAAVSPLKGVALDAALDQLTSSELVFRRGAPPDVTYAFKHALVQDAAYDSLLKSQRYRLHAQIAQRLEGHFPDIVSNEPEALAHHFTEARLHERAVPYWVQAAQRAMRRVALSEAVGHLSMALSTIERLPACVERDRQELDVRMLSAQAYQSLLGWPAGKIVELLEPARELATRLGEQRKLGAVLAFFINYNLDRCEYAGAQQCIEQLKGLAQSLSNSVMIIGTQAMKIQVCTHMGRLREARQAADHLLPSFDTDESFIHIPIFNHELKSGTRVVSAICMMSSGYADKAQKAVASAISGARRLGHPFHLAWCLNIGSGILLQRGETGAAREWIEEALAIARDNAMTFMLDCFGPMHSGWALIEDGQYAEGYTKVTRAQTLWRDAGGLAGVPSGNVLRARALIGLGRFDEARSALDDALQIINRTGHRLAEAEVRRIRGELRRLQPAADIEGAADSFMSATDVARAQEAKLWELRAATSLASLWRDQGKRSDARALLAPVYDWFTEGFGTRDLRDAKILLDELA